MLWEVGGGNMPESILSQERVCLELIEPEKLEELQSKIGWNFEQPFFLALALTHCSCRRDVRNHPVVQCNERLEFLGDGLLKAAICSHLYRKYPLESEKVMSQIRSYLEGNQYLGLVAEEFGLTSFVVLAGDTVSNYNSNEGTRCKILADTLEAIIGALFLDGGFTAVESFLERIIFLNIETIKASFTNGVVAAKISK
jgi:ribonuclease-3